MFLNVKGHIILYPTENSNIGNNKNKNNVCQNTLKFNGSFFFFLLKIMFNSYI